MCQSLYYIWKTNKKTNMETKHKKCFVIYKWFVYIFLVGINKLIGNTHKFG